MLGVMTFAEQCRMLALMKELPATAASVSEEFGREDPREFITEVLGLKPTSAALRHGYTVPWTPDQERVMISVRDNRRTACPSGHGTGKTFCIACLVIWFLYRREGSIVVTTAPTARQVEKILWAEIRSLRAGAKLELPGGGNLTEIKLAEKWFAIGISTSARSSDISATQFQGWHSRHVMMVYDEATGVVPEIKAGGDGITMRPDDRQIAIANPTDPTAWFKEACDTWSKVHLDCESHPNVIHDDPEIIPGAVTKEWIEDRLDEYHSRDSALFKSKVRGLFPDQAADALIRLEWVTRAQRFLGLEDEVEDFRGCAFGLDIAGEGEDLTVLWACKNGRTWIPQLRRGYAWHVGRDVMQAVKLVLEACSETPDVRSIALDETGLGQGVFARLRELRKEGRLPRFQTGGVNQAISQPVNLIPVSFGSTAWKQKRYADKKSQLWMHGRDLLRQEKALIPGDEELAAYKLPKGNSLPQQLMTAIYTDRRGKVIVLDKRSAGGAGFVEKTKNLPEKSPDLAHAWLLAVWAWSRNRARKDARNPVNVQDAFSQQTRAMIEKSRRKKKIDPKRSALLPWQRRAR